MPVDELYMELALREAAIAGQKGEVPIGAVAVWGNDIIAKTHNLRESLNDPTAHAEILLLKQVSAKLNKWRLKDLRVYVTLEPCLMCAGALILARVSTLIYGADDPKAGAIKSLYNILDDNRLNHRIEVVSGVKGEECGRILADFFKARRQNKSEG
ncbi:MAG: nucleoside deaminase [Candidatus Schekmanbacteria bacterium]|nr:nucleoside deaminase [Candidatus Schekmanbacteria bacterium]